MAMATLMVTPLERPGGSWLLGILWEQNSLIRIAALTENGTIVLPSPLTQSRHCVKTTTGARRIGTLAGPSWLRPAKHNTRTRSTPIETPTDERISRPLLSYLLMSRWTTRVALPRFCSDSFIDSAIITERCFPPVHPNAMVR